MDAVVAAGMVDDVPVGDSEDRTASDPLVLTNTALVTRAGVGTALVTRAGVGTALVTRAGVGTALVTRAGVGTSLVTRAGTGGVFATGDEAATALVTRAGVGTALVTGAGAGGVFATGDEGGAFQSFGGTCPLAWPPLRSSGDDDAGGGGGGGRSKPSSILSSVIGTLVNGGGFKVMGEMRRLVMITACWLCWDDCALLVGADVEEEEAGLLLEEDSVNNWVTRVVLELLLLWWSFIESNGKPAGEGKVRVYPTDGEVVGRGDRPCAVGVVDAAAGVCDAANEVLVGVAPSP